MTTNSIQFKTLLPSAAGGAVLLIALLLLCHQGKKPNLLGQSAGGAQTTRAEIEQLIKMSNELADRRDYESALKSRAMAFKLNKNAGLYKFNDASLTRGLEDKIFTHIDLDTLKTAINRLPKDIITADYLNTIARQVLERFNSDYTIELAQKALSLSSEPTDTLQQAAAYHNIGISYYNRDKYKEAEPYFKKSNNIFTSICDTTGMIVSGNMYGRSVGDLFRLNESEEILKETVALARTYKNANLLFGALGRIRDLKWSQGNYKEAQHLEIEIREVALETRDSYNIIVAKWDEGLTFQYMGNYREALPLFGAAVRWDKDHHINVDLPQDYYILASCFNGLGVYDSAVYYYQKDIQISTQFNSFTYLSSSLQDLALLNFEINNKQTAKEYIEKANQVYREKGIEKYQPVILAEFYKWQATVMEREGQLDSAIFYAKKYFDVLEGNGVIGEVPKASNLLGKLYHRKGEIELAKAHLLQALKMTKEIGLLAPQCETLMLLGEIYTKEQAYSQAIQTLKESLELAQNSYQIGLLADIYQNLARAQSEAGDFQSAFQYQARCNTLKDSLLGIDRKARIAMYEAAFKADEKELDNEKLRAEEKQRNYNLQKRNLVIMALAAGIALITIAAYLNRERVKYHTEQKLRKDITRDIHDDVGSTLNDLKLTIKEALNEEAKDEVTEKKLTSAIQLSSQAMVSLNNLIWKLDNAEASLARFIAEARAFTDEMLEAHQITFQFRATGFESKRLLPPATYRHLLLIYKEAIQNAIKHGDREGINIKLANTDGHLSLTVKNRIPPRKHSELGTNKGLLNMQARSAALKGDISFNKTADCFELCLNLTI